MRRPRKRRRNDAKILLIFGSVLIVGGLALWIFYWVRPLWFPGWFNTLFAVLEGLGVFIAVLGAVLSDIFLPLWDRLASHNLPLTREPIHRIDYRSLIATLGKSGQIPWIDRGVVSSSLLSSYGRIAIVGPMKSGKTREAAELIRMAQQDGLLSVIYEPIVALDLIGEDTLQRAITEQVEPQRCLFFVDELGLRQNPEHLERLSTCIWSICEARPNAYFLITVQSERLSATVRGWLQEHQFYHVSMPTLTSNQRRKLAETGSEMLEAAISEQAITALTDNNSITKPWDVVSVLQYAPPRDSNREPLSEEDVRTFLARTEQDIWAEQRREVAMVEPAAEPLLRSIATFMSAGVTPRQSTVQSYAFHLMSSSVPRGKRKQSLDGAAQRWRRYDIIASDGLYTIPEPRLLPLIIDEREARTRLRAFAQEYNPGPGTSLALAVMRPVDAVLRKIRLLWFRRLRLSVNLRSKLRSVRFFRLRLGSGLRSKLKRIARRLPSWDFESRLVIWLSGTLFSWPADRALLLQELGSPATRAAYLSSAALVQTGQRARDDGNYVAALDHFDKALALAPDHVPAIAHRGVTYAQMGRYEPALADFDRAIELAPDDAWALAHRGETYLRMGRYEPALADLDRAIDLDPDYAWALARRGETYRLLGRYEPALADLDRAIDLDPDYAWALARRGETYRLMGRYEPALADLDRAIDLGPNYAWALASRGVTYLRMGRYEPALADLDRAIELEPEDDWFHYGRGLTYQLTGQATAAKDDLATAIGMAREAYERDPHEWQNALNLAIYYLAAGETDKAEQLYRRALAEQAPTYCLREALCDLDEFLLLFPGHCQAQAMRDLLQNRLQEAQP